jgi:HEAT repeat protein
MRLEETPVLKQLVTLAVFSFCAWTARPADQGNNPAELWGRPETEAAALAEMKSLVSSNDLETAAWLAGKFAELAAREPCPLRNPDLWRKLGRALDAGNRYSDNDRRYDKERAADLLGLPDLCYLHFGDIVREDAGERVLRSALYALRKKEYTRANEFLEWMETLSAESKKPLVQKQIELIRDCVKNPQDPERLVKLAVETLAKEHSGYAYHPREAIELLAPLLHQNPVPPEDLRKKVYRLLVHWTLMDTSMPDEDRWHEVRVWLQRADMDFPQNKDLLADLLLTFGVGLSKRGRDDEALRCFRQVATECPGARVWPDAQFNVGHLLLQERKFKEAIPVFERLLTAAVDNTAPSSDIMSPFKNYQHRAAEDLVEALEGLADFPAALKLLKESADKYPLRSWCGTCEESERTSRVAHTRLLETLVKKPDATRQEWAALAVEELRKGNTLAARMLTALGADALPALRAAAKDDDLSVKRAVADALLNLGAQAAPAVPELILLVQENRGENVRRSAAECLAKIGPAAADAIPALLNAGKYQAVRAIGPREEHVLLLVNHLLDGRKADERHIFGILAAMGPQAKTAVPTLLEAGMKLTDSRSACCYQIPGILGTIGQPSVEPVMRIVRESYENRKRPPHFLQETVGALAPHLVDHVSLFVGMFRDREWQSIAVAALKGIGQPAVQPLMELLNDQDSFVRQGAIETLGSMAAAAKPALPRLIELLKDHDLQTRWYAVVALNQLAPNDASVLPPLLEAVKDLDERTKVSVLKTMLTTESAAVDLIPAIEPLTRSGEPETRKTAREVVNSLSVIKRLQQNLATK